jgi:hypothetical protein
MKVYCPKCRDLYTPASEYNNPPSTCGAVCVCAIHSPPRGTNVSLLPALAVDGSYFGTTFPHLFFLTYRELEPPPSTLLYVPRVFGYKIHNKSENRRRLAILAKEDDAAAEEEEKQQQVCTLSCVFPPSSRIHWGQRPGRHLARSGARLSTKREGVAGPADGRATLSVPPLTSTSEAGVLSSPGRTRNRLECRPGVLSAWPACLPLRPVVVRLM